MKENTQYSENKGKYTILSENEAKYTILSEI
jgi:hypothetical protein